MDGSVIRAHQHAAGAAGSDANREALGYSKGGFSTKIHLRCDGNGKPVTFSPWESATKQTTHSGLTHVSFIIL